MYLAFRFFLAGCRSRIAWPVESGLYMRCVTGQSPAAAHCALRRGQKTPAHRCGCASLMPSHPSQGLSCHHIQGSLPLHTPPEHGAFPCYWCHCMKTALNELPRYPSQAVHLNVFAVLQARMAARVKENIIKKNGGKAPSAGHPFYKFFKEACQRSQELTDSQG